MARYATGLIGAFLVFGLVCALAIVPMMLLKGQPARALEFMTVWMLFGVPTLAILAFVVGPIVLGADRLFRNRLPAVVALLAGIGAGPAVVLLAWLAFRESGETFSGLLRFWWRVPGEFVVGVVPGAAAGAFFSVWLTRKQRRLGQP